MKKLDDVKKADNDSIMVEKKEKPIPTMPVEQAMAYVDEVMGRTHVLIDN